MGTMRSFRVGKTLAVGALAGIAGGAAEIGWIVLYGAATGTPINPVARGITASVIPAFAPLSWSGEFGVFIHLGLAVALGMGLAIAFRLVMDRTDGHRSGFGLVMLALATVWAVNFLVALPHINPAFVQLLPYGVTLLSKLLFGVAAASVFRAGRLHRAQVSP